MNIPFNYGEIGKDIPGFNKYVLTSHRRIYNKEIKDWVQIINNKVTLQDNDGNVVERSINRFMSQIFPKEKEIPLGKRKKKPFMRKDNGKPRRRYR